MAKCHESDHSFITSSTNGDVYVETLDNLMGSVFAGVTSISVPKIEIKSGEADCLEGARRFIMKYIPTIICEVYYNPLNPSSASIEVLKNRIESLQYDVKVLAGAHTPTFIGMPRCGSLS